jgi:5-methylcytosine-specific restriction endonuclease McrA
MENCKKCNREFEPIKGLKSYCSMECRNSRIWSESHKIKLSISAKKSNKVKEANKRNGNDPERIKKYKQWAVENRKRKIIQIMQTSFENLNWPDRRIKIYYEQECKCNTCGNDKWQDKDIPLELEHKDGNHFNNERSNLELLCPNCHALTDTWRGRNKKNQKPKGYKISDETLLEALLNNNWNMRQALIEVELAPKGANYPRCHRIKREYLGPLVQIQPGLQTK